MNPDIPAKVERFPDAPGVYVFVDARGSALYVGKAARLRSRVRSYLSPGGDGRVSIPFIVEQADDVEFMVTRTEQEALLLENTVIKKRKPAFNVKLKDDKSFLLLRLDLTEDWPWFRLVRRRRDDGCLYFGPYASAKSVRRTLRLLHKVVPLRDCSDTVFQNRSRPCIKFQIDRCPAPCVGEIDSPAYRGLVDKAIGILDGDAAPVLSALRLQMDAAANDLEFERAQVLKGQIEALSLVAERQDVVGSDRSDHDVLGLHRAGDEVSAVFLLYRVGRLESSRRFAFRSRLPEDLLLADLLGRFYEGDRYVPQSVLVPGDVAEAQLVQDWLSSKRGRKVELACPKRGRRLQYLKTACDNARLTDEVQADRAARGRRGVEELGELLELPDPPELIHCLDVSTTQGRQTVASRVAFDQGVSHRQDYRRFKISADAAGDDFAAMNEAVRRSLTLGLTKEGEEMPDLMIVDGGAGQVTAAMNAMRDLGLSDDVELVGLAKSRSKGQGADRHRTDERLFRHGVAEPVHLAPDAPVTLLVAAIRDEAHRFAITYHRKLRGKLTSVLDEIEGIGPGRRRTLLRHFGSLTAVKNATLEQLTAVPGVPEQVGRRVYRHLRPGS